MFKSFIISINHHKKLIYKTSALLCLTTSIGYLWNSNIVSKPIYASESDLKFKKLKCKKLIKRFKEEYGVPGIVIGVSVNGETIYKKAIGYSDVENNQKANVDTIMRIASISKPITCAISAKLFELNKLDLDKSVNDYLNNLTVFNWNDKNVEITARQLMSHTSGIRHYEKNVNLNGSNEKNQSNDSDTNYKEFYIKDHFDKTSDALSIFINDKLLFEPSTNFYYTTYGYTLLSAVLECVSDRKFTQLLGELFKYFEMNQTYIDENNPLIPNRSKYYTRNNKGRLENVPYVDNSYKWAGGGILSNVGDLMKFGNCLLFNYQNDSSKNYLKQNTIRNYIWSKQSIPFTNRKDKIEKPPIVPPIEKSFYGFGWQLVFDDNEHLKRVYHTGGAVGASSCIMIIPKEIESSIENPNGIVVVVLCNSDTTSGIVNFTHEIAKIFMD